MFLSANAGKRSLGLSSVTRAGAMRSCASPTAPTCSSRACAPASPRSSGSARRSFRDRSPRLVYCSLGAYGRTGPLAGEPGTTR